MENILGEYSLIDFQKYDATNPGRIIHSTSEESARKWVRKGPFTQLMYALELYSLDHTITLAQSEAMRSFNEHVLSDEFRQKPLTEKADISKALDTLEAFGVDVSRQREQLATWDEVNQSS